jgi:transposase InsO family protein
MHLFALTLGFSRRTFYCSSQGKAQDRTDPTGGTNRITMRAGEFSIPRKGDIWVPLDRYGYRRVTGLLREAGWRVNRKRVERIWRREGLKDPARQPKRGRLWLNDGSCIRLRPERPNHVWAYDFVADRTHECKAYRMLTVIDEFTRESLAIIVGRRINSHDVFYTLADLFIRCGIPAHIRSDNGP